MPKSIKHTRSPAELRAQLKKQKAKAVAKCKSAPHTGKSSPKKKPAATKAPAIKAGSTSGLGRDVVVAKRPASHLKANGPQFLAKRPAMWSDAQTLAKRPAAATPEKLVDPVSVPKSDNPFCWLRREDKIRAEHEAIMEGLRREKKEMEEKYQTQVQAQRDAMFASLSQTQVETRRIMDDLRMKQALEVERRAYAEGRAHAMAKLWRRGGFLSRSLASENHSRRRSGRHALSDTNSIQGEEGEGYTPHPVGTNEEEIATAALAAAASRVAEVPLVMSAAPSVESGGARDASGLGTASAASGGRSGSQTSPQADQHASRPPVDGLVPSIANHRRRSSRSKSDLERALAPTQALGVVETRNSSEANSSGRRSTGKGDSKGGIRRSSKGSGKTAQPTERILPRAKAPPTAVAPIGEEL